MQRQRWAVKLLDSNPCLVRLIRDAVLVSARTAKVEQDADREFRSFLSKTIGNPFSSNASDFDAPLDLVSFYEHVWNQGYPMNQLFGVQFPLRYYNTTQNTLMLRPPPFSIHMNYLVSSGHSAKMHQENLLTFIAKTLRLLNQEESAAEADARDILEFERRLAFVRSIHRIRLFYFSVNWIEFHLWFWPQKNLVERISRGKLSIDRKHLRSHWTNHTWRTDGSIAKHTVEKVGQHLVASNWRFHGKQYHFAI